MITYTYKDLKNKYEDFKSPVVQIQINGSRLEDKDNKIEAVSYVKVENTSGYEAGIATFHVYNVFDHVNGCFKMDNLEKNFQIGLPVVIGLGYDATLEIVFRGYISGLRFVTEKARGQYLEVTAMDVKGQMMANCYSRQFKGKLYSECVKEILSQDAYSNILENAFEVSMTPEQMLKNDNKDFKSIDMVEESDYEFVVKAAKKFAYDFFSDGDYLYFRKPKSDTVPIATLGYGEGIMFSSMDFSITGMVGQVEVRSSDPGKGQKFSKTMNISGNYNTRGSMAKQIVSKTKKVYIDPTIDTQKMAELRAQALVEQLQYKFGHVELECVGIPDIKPGKFLNLTTLMKGKEVECYIDTVTHMFDSDQGYTTLIKGRVKEFPK